MLVREQLGRRIGRYIRAEAWVLPVLVGFSIGCLAWLCGEASRCCSVGERRGAQENPPAGSAASKPELPVERGGTPADWNRQCPGHWRARTFLCCHTGHTPPGTDFLPNPGSAIFLLLRSAVRRFLVFRSLWTKPQPWQRCVAPAVWRRNFCVLLCSTSVARTCCLGSPTFSGL